MEVWIGFVELRQLPGSGHAIELTGKGAYTWITCWADSEKAYLDRVKAVEEEYGLFVVEAEEVMPFSVAEQKGIVTDELLDLFERTGSDQQFCIFGTFHSYRHDN